MCKESYIDKKGRFINVDWFYWWFKIIYIVVWFVYVWFKKMLDKINEYLLIMMVRNGNLDLCN